MAALSVRRVSALAAIAVALIAGAVFAAGRIDRDGVVTADARQQAGQRLLTAMLDEESGGRDFLLTRRPALLAPLYRGATDFAAALAASRRLDRGDSSLIGSLIGSLIDQAHRSAAWQAALQAQIAAARSTGARPTVAQSLTADALMDAFRDANTLYASC
ncbi:MAG: CHASE3 domain-containing protein [Solirubrobacteraceae bacterium]